MKRVRCLAGKSDIFSYETNHIQYLTKKKKKRKEKNSRIVLLPTKEKQMFIRVASSDGLKTRLRYPWQVLLHHFYVLSYRGRGQGFLHHLV